MFTYNVSGTQTRTRVETTAFLCTVSVENFSQLESAVKNTLGDTTLEYIDSVELEDDNDDNDDEELDEDEDLDSEVSTVPSTYNPVSPAATARTAPAPAPAVAFARAVVETREGGYSPVRVQHVPG